MAPSGFYESGKWTALMTDGSKMVQTVFGNWFNFGEYCIDAWQRQVLFWDVIRKRGNLYLEHLSEGQPPVLVFEYDMILDARQFKRPVNYALVKINDRRHPGQERRKHGKRISYDVLAYPRIQRSGSDRRAPMPQGPGFEEKADLQETRSHKPKSPIVIIDPRAGHGPGIGGSKLQSEIGVALTAGYTVYFVLFFTQPMPGQTLADVEQAEVRFLEEVQRRYPEAGKPVVIGNCQAGWAAALVGADRPDLVDLVIMNGAPLSYHSGKFHPMRDFGGLVGPHMGLFMCYLGNGRFDGAWLVFSFELLNPANTYWTKQYNLYAGVDDEERRYLDFEKWWGGFFLLNEEEMKFISGELFIGNRLEKGLVQLDDRKIDLRQLKRLLIFASEGDNITPHTQALGWIPAVYDSLEDLEASGNTIVYIVDKRIGHLGIFVSGRIAEKVHGSIIYGLDAIGDLPPGLFEMVITREQCANGACTYLARFEKRRVVSIREMNADQRSKRSLENMSATYTANTAFLETYVKPWVRLWVTEESAELSRQLHPLRMQRYLFSDRNPWTLPVKAMAPWVKAMRRPVDKENTFLRAERHVSSYIEAGLNAYRDARDQYSSWLFERIYGNFPTDIHRWIRPPAPHLSQDGSSGSLRQAG